MLCSVLYPITLSLVKLIWISYNLCNVEYNENHCQNHSYTNMRTILPQQHCKKVQMNDDNIFLQTEMSVLAHEMKTAENSNQRVFIAFFEYADSPITA